MILLFQICKLVLAELVISSELGQFGEPPRQCVTEWTCTGKHYPVRLNDNGDVECMSRNNQQCIREKRLSCHQIILKYGSSLDLYSFSCGPEHEYRF